MNMDPTAVLFPALQKFRGYGLLLDVLKPERLMKVMDLIPLEKVMEHAGLIYATVGIVAMATASSASDAKAPGKPTELDGFIEPKKGSGPAMKAPSSGGKKGWVDRAGDIWIPTGPGDDANKPHGGPHWDVVDKDGKNHRNVYPGGHVRKHKQK